MLVGSGFLDETHLSANLGLTSTWDQLTLPFDPQKLTNVYWQILNSITQEWQPFSRKCHLGTIGWEGVRFNGNGAMEEWKMGVGCNANGTWMFGARRGLW